MRIRIVQAPPIRGIDGIRLDCFSLGSDYDVGNTIGALFLAEGWAEPIPLDAPAFSEPLSGGDGFVKVIRDRAHPRNLIRQTHPPYLDVQQTAADLQKGRRRRSRYLTLNFTSTVHQVT